MPFPCPHSTKKNHAPSRPDCMVRSLVKLLRTVFSLLCIFCIFASFLSFSAFRNIFVVSFPFWYKYVSSPGFHNKSDLLFVKTLSILNLSIHTLFISTLYTPQLSTPLVLSVISKLLLGVGLLQYWRIRCYGIFLKLVTDGLTWSRKVCWSLPYIKHALTCHGCICRNENFYRSLKLH